MQHSLVCNLSPSMSSLGKKCSSLYDDGRRKNFQRNYIYSDFKVFKDEEGGGENEEEKEEEEKTKEKNKKKTTRCLKEVLLRKLSTLCGKKCKIFTYIR